MASLLLSAGHPDAYDYALGMLSDEASLVIERVNGQEATRATLLQVAVASVVSKDAGRLFRESIDRLTDGG